MSLALLLSLALSQPAAEAVPPVEAPPEEAAVSEKPAPEKEPAAPSGGLAPSVESDSAKFGAGKQPKVPTIRFSSDVPWWQRLSVGGFARVGVFYNFPFADDQLVGSNGGFRVADFRLNFEFKPIEKFTAYTSVEFAAPLVDPNDPLVGRRIVDLRDAYVQYDVADFFQVRAGQFRPPYYAEMLLSDGAIPFVNRSVLAGGLHPPEAYGPRNALAPDRQIGVQLFSRRLGGDTLGLKYAVGVFNGNGQNALFNDNNMVQPVARVEIDVMKHVTLGLNGYYNQRAEGVRPNRLYVNQLAYGADLEAHVGGLSGLVAFLGKSSTFSYAGLQPDNALGALAQVRYLHEATGLEAAVRGAWYEPSAAQVDDQVIEVAAMVGWRPAGLPFRLLVQYTHRSEEQRVSYPNDSVDAMIHAVW